LLAEQLVEQLVVGMDVMGIQKIVQYLAEHWVIWLLMV